MRTRVHVCVWFTGRGVCGMSRPSIRWPSGRTDGLRPSRAHGGSAVGVACGIDSLRRESGSCP